MTIGIILFYDGGTMIRNFKKKVVIVIILVSLIGLSYYTYIHPEAERMEYQNFVKIDYKISITMVNESTGTCNYFLPGYQNREGDFLDINNDVVIDGNGTINNWVETKYGPALEVVANGSFSIFLNKSYHNILSINDTGFEYLSFWIPSLYSIDDTVPHYILGHFWIYYNGSNCNDNVSISIQELSIFRYRYSGLYYSLSSTSILEPIGWTRISSDRNVLATN